MEHILEQFILDWHRLRVFVQLRDRSGQNVNETQYINGGLYAGGGVYIEGHARRGCSVIKFDENAVRDIATQDAKARELLRTGFVILR